MKTSMKLLKCSSLLRVVYSSCKAVMCWTSLLSPCCGAVFSFAFSCSISLTLQYVRCGGCMTVRWRTRLLPTSVTEIHFIWQWKNEAPSGNSGSKACPLPNKPPPTCERLDFSTCAHSCSQWQMLIFACSVKTLVLFGAVLVDKGLLGCLHCSQCGDNMPVWTALADIQWGT